MAVTKQIFLILFIPIILSLVLVAKSAPTEIYQWKDESGTLHFTEDESAGILTIL